MNSQIPWLLTSYPLNQLVQTLASCDHVYYLVDRNK
jgi:hypothetical protein